MRRMKNQKLLRRTFNLVEITIALMILATGLIAILGVFPIAATNSRDAAGTHYAAAAGEEMLNFISAQVERDWAFYVAGLRPNATQTNPLTDVARAFPADPSAAGLDKFTKYLPNGIGNSGIWGHDTDSSVYRVIVETSSSGGTLAAFDGIARVWKSTTAGYYYDTATSTWQAGEDVNYERSAQINIEISWPATVKYEARRKAYYALEVTKND